MSGDKSDIVFFLVEFLFDFLFKISRRFWRIGVGIDNNKNRDIGGVIITVNMVENCLTKTEEC